MNFFPIPVQMCSRCLNSQFLNQCPHILLSPLFQAMFQAPGQKKQNGKRNCQLPPNSFSSNLRDIPPDISIDPLWLYISPEFLLNFLSNLYSQQFAENCQIHGAWIMKNCTRHFYSCPSRQNSPPSFYPSGRRKLLIPPIKRFLKIYTPQQNKRDGKAMQTIAALGEKMVQITINDRQAINYLFPQGARMVRELFEMARSKKACIIFFDEIDAVGGN